METRTIEPGTVDELEVRVADDPASAPLSRIAPVPAAASATTPMQMLAAALAAGIDEKRLEQLMNLAERWEANEARKAYVAAFARFKAEPIEIRRNKLVNYPAKDPGKAATRYKHPTLDHVCDQIVQKLAKYGFSHSWRPRTENNKVIVTTRLEHKQGHHEEVTLDAAPDTSGNKNAIQSVGSAIYYLERYGLMAICGLAPKDATADDDGRSTSGDPGEQPEGERLRPAAAASSASAPYERTVGDVARTEPGSNVIRAGAAPLRIIRKEMLARGVLESNLCKHFDITCLEDLGMKRVNDVLAWIKGLT